MRTRWTWVFVVVAVGLVAVAVTLGGGTPSATTGPGTPVAASSGSGGTEPGMSVAPPMSVTPPSASGTTTPSPALPSAGAAEPLSMLLGMLRIAPEDRTGYSRSLFVHWIDADGDGCDTRREVLIAEAVVKPTIGSHCSLSGGRWFSLYDGLTFRDPSKLQIDHVVALAEAWDSGASAWTPDRRTAYANDLDAWFALIAVSGTTNQSKSDDDPADWLPPAPAAECPYLGAWIATKVRWDLAVDQREEEALATDLAGCATTTMPYLPAGSAGEVGGQTPGPTDGASLPAGSACDPAYPTVCIPPPPPDLDCGEIPFRNFKVLAPDPHRFDGDHDGIGCET